ncbi:MAG: DUF192 domain-containing protein [Rhodoferax sp.]
MFDPLGRHGFFCVRWGRDNVDMKMTCWVSCRAAAVGLTLMLASTQAALAQSPQMNLPRTTLTAGFYRIEVQVAQHPLEREMGLMYRDQMPANEGMLFVFERPDQQCFWMKNTRLPLTAAFVADDGTLVNLADMKPNTLDSHCSAKPVRYVLEMNQGWFAQKGLRPGMRLSGAPFQSKP